MSNIYEAKFKAFAKKLSEKNANHHAADVGSKSQQVFADYPFSIEYKTVYKIAKWGQSLSQIVTFCTTAALGVFALSHVIPLSFGLYIAVPIALIFAFGVEKIKRSTLAIAAKHMLKYGAFGFVGFVAVLVMLVSIGAALYGASQLPGVFYPLPQRTNDPAAVAALSSDIDRVQADIDRLQSGLKSEKNWIAENRTLPKLQKQRADLVDKRDQATKEAATRGDQVHAEALAERAAKVDKMQVYSVGAAIIAELIFLLCTVFVFYFLFRHYAEENPEAADDSEGEAMALHSQPAPATRAQMNGRPVAQNFRGSQPAVYTIPADVPARARDDYRNDATTIFVDSNSRKCEHCKTPYIHRHSKQRFCGSQCRVDAWEAATGRKMNRGKPKPSA